MNQIHTLLAGFHQVLQDPRALLFSSVYQKHTLHHSRKPYGGSARELTLFGHALQVGTVKSGGCFLDIQMKVKERVVPASELGDEAQGEMGGKGICTQSKQHSECCCDGEEQEVRCLASEKRIKK